MKRTLLVALLLALCFVASATAAPTSVYLTNHSTAVTDSELAAMLPALQAQVSGEFYDAWGIDAKLVVGEAPAGAADLEITDEATIAGALGYHDVCRQDGNGYPCGYVFAKTTLDAGLSVSVTLDHELLELLADPLTSTFEKVGRRFYLREVGDPVEGDQFGYERDGILLSDFVTPFYYRAGHVGPYDFQDVVSRPLQVMPDGYLSWIGADGLWHQKFARGLRGVA
jgi:hypothetical protein